MKAIKSIPASLFILIVISLIIRCIGAYTLGLGNDEVYYITYALNPGLSHFDHPPMVGFLIQLTTLNLSVLSEFTMRLGAVITGTGSVILIYLIGSKLKNKRTGLIAAYISTASIYLTVICGTFMTPDPALLFFILLSFYFFMKYIPGNPADAKQLDIWLSFLFFGLAIYSKYQACYLGFGILLYIIIFNRKWLAKGIMYIGALIPIFFIGLIVYWNYKNNFAGTSFQSSRIISITDVDLVDFFREIGGEIAYFNPVNIVLIVMALFSFRKLKYIDSKYFKLILCCSLPLLFTVWFMAVSSATLPHWVGISYVLLFILAAAYLDKKLKNLKFPTYYAYIVLCIAIIAITIAKFGIFIPGGYVPETKDSVYTKAIDNPPEPVKWEQKLGKRDFTLDMEKWTDVNTVYKNYIINHPEFKNYPLVGCQWFTAAHIDYYVAMPNDIKLLMYGRMSSIHEYYWLNKKRGGLKVGDNALYISTSHHFIAPQERFNPYFESYTLLHRAPVFRRGKIVMFVFIYELKSFKGDQDSLLH
jgi:hypothetical protein